MDTVFSESHIRHNPGFEFFNGRLVPHYEQPRRAEAILQAVRDSKLGSILPPRAFSTDSIKRVHDEDFVNFLSMAWEMFEASMSDQERAFPYTSWARGAPPAIPDTINGKMAYYAFDVVTPLTQGSWHAAMAAASTALTGLDLVLSGAPSAFALCRPPGHHVMADQYGGYGFLNNTAIAAQAALDASAERIAIIDIDYHHGNGTQNIFYHRNDVFFASIHGDPKFAYPYFSGAADEIGINAGVGFNLNLPLPQRTAWHLYEPALKEAINCVDSFRPDIVVISLGVDTFENDPLCAFCIQAGQFPLIGNALATLGRPTLFVMEGGYDIETIGDNVVGVLRGFEDK